jgi:hypothetical protein
MAHRYICSYKAVKYARKPCIGVAGREIDNAVVTRLLNVLGRPPVAMLKEALAEARQSELVKAKAIDAERQRLEHQERTLRHQFDNCDPEFHLVFHDLQLRLNNILEEKRCFEERVLAERSCSAEVTNEKEVEELCKLVSEVPAIWFNPLVTDHERKEIIRCLIEKIVVDVTELRIEGTIHWVSGLQEPFQLYRRFS